MSLHDSGARLPPSATSAKNEMAELDDGRSVLVRGRAAWALTRLKAEPTGCSVFDIRAPRWSSYVHRLRKLGLLSAKDIAAASPVIMHGTSCAAKLASSDLSVAEQPLRRQRAARVRFSLPLLPYHIGAAHNSERLPAPGKRLWQKPAG